MPDASRIEDLRRRIERDPASIAFAQLAEECRRAGLAEEAIAICRAGLALHPGYLSARVTLGRALLQANRLDEAELELGIVLRTATQNLAAMRGLAEIHRRRGRLTEALDLYQQALALAKNDPDLRQAVRELTAETAIPEAGMQEASSRELSLQAGSIQEVPAKDAAIHEVAMEAVAAGPSNAAQSGAPRVKPSVTPGGQLMAAARTIFALEQFLAAIHVARAYRRP